MVMQTREDRVDIIHYLQRAGHESWMARGPGYRVGQDVLEVVWAVSREVPTCFCGSAR